MHLKRFEIRLVTKRPFFPLRKNLALPRRDYMDPRDETQKVC